MTRNFVDGRKAHSISFDLVLADRLAAFAKANELSCACVVRAAVTKFLADQGKRGPGRPKKTATSL